MHQENVTLGACFVVVAAFAFAVVGALVKLVSASLPNEMVVFFRNLFGLLALVPLLNTGLRGLRTACFHWHLLRAGAGLGAMYCFFYALAHLNLAEAVLLSYTTPLFTPIVAYLWLKEPVPMALRWAVVVGFAGVVLILKPAPTSFSPVSVIALSAGLFAAIALIAIRRMSRTEPITRIVFYFGLAGTVVSAIPLVWAWTTPHGRDLWILVFIGLFATIGQLFLTKAYAVAPAARVGPFTYASVVFAAVLGWLFWDQVPDGLSFIGTVLVVAGGVIAMTREFSRRRSA